jgi:catechol 2,3-dioxygenase-like lactoylglutathione lyase family enzyme
MLFVATSDAARATAFYRDALGLRFVADEDYAVIFDCGGITLRVQKVAKVVAPPYTILGWQVDDIAAALASLRAARVACERYDFLAQDDRGVWTAPGGARVAWFKDPDGNLLSLTQLPR